jgi:precorrin-3B C17-methyltransferase
MNRKSKTLFLVGIGPGGHKDMTAHCIAVLRNCDVVVGYQRYIDLVKPFITGKEVISSGMAQEVERCSKAIEVARKGKTVALISSGDPGVYGMAGLALELINKKRLYDTLEVEIVPGVPAVHAAAARLGAPLMNDYAVISLSDLLTPWEVIVKRLTHAAQADFVICLYNPRSRSRTDQIREAQKLLLRFRKPDTPVGIARNVSRKGESITLTTLGKMLRYKIDMLTLIIVGNSTTVVRHNRMITPRGYFRGRC